MFDLPLQLPRLSFALTLVAGTLLAGPALAEAPQDTVHLTGIPYGADGAYYHSGDFYNDKPVYTLDHSGTTWSLYQRENGRWYVDFDDLDETWSGTVAEGPSADFPWGGSWGANQAASPVGSIVLGGAPYTSSTTGVYTWNGGVYNGKPVFEHVGGGTTWSLYQRQNGRWYVDFDDVDEAWSGTVAEASVAETPFDATWSNANMAVSSTATIELSGAVYSVYNAGTYSFDGQTIYNGAPVFQLVDGVGTTWSIYRRQNGLWYLDFNDVSEDWDGTVEVGPDAMAPMEGEWDDPEVLVTSGAAAPLPLRGRLDFGTFAGGTDCRDLDFAQAFDADDVNIQVSPDHANGPGTHDAIVVWVEGVDRWGARICARETSNFDGAHDANLSISYLAYRPGAVLDGERGRFEDSDGFTGVDNHCNTVAFDQTFAVEPIVQATITHPDTFSGNHDAMSVWIEGVSTTDFTVCVRETADMGTDHSDYAIDWIAHEAGTWPFYGADEGAVDDVAAFEDTACFAYGFTTPYTDTPQVFVTADHRDAGGNHDATTVWLEDLSTTGFTACVRELANPGNPGSNATGAHNADLQLAWTAVGNR
jgi:hypothetical protein